MSGRPSLTRERTVTFAPVRRPSLPVQVVADPMPTLLTSLVEWFGPLRSRVPSPLRRQAAALVRGLDVGALAALMANPLNGGSPDFLTRLDVAVSVPSVRDGIDLIRAVPEEDVLHDIDETIGAGCRPDHRHPVAAVWHRNTQHALADLCQALDRYWHGVVIHVYPDIERRLRRASQQLQDAVNEIGPQCALVALHPRLRFDLAATSSVSLLGGGPGGRAASTTVTGLVIRPMIANRLTLCTNSRLRPQLAAFAAPTPGLAVATSPPVGDPLTLLIGDSRAGLVRRLQVRPATTTGLAEASGLVPSTVSHHLGSLRDAGVVAAYRQGQSVLYSLTERGHRLLGLG